MTIKTDRGDVSIRIGTAEKPAVTDDDGLIFTHCGQLILVWNHGESTRRIDGQSLGWTNLEYVLKPTDYMCHTNMSYFPVDATFK